jgi:hypothetical protein
MTVLWSPEPRIFFLSEVLNLFEVGAADLEVLAGVK